MPRACCPSVPSIVPIGSWLAIFSPHLSVPLPKVCSLRVWCTLVAAFFLGRCGLVAYHLQTKGRKSMAGRRPRINYYQAKIPGNWYGRRGKNTRARALSAGWFSDGEFRFAFINLAKWNVSGISAVCPDVGEARVFARFAASRDFHLASHATVPLALRHCSKYRIERDSCYSLGHEIDAREGACRIWNGAAG